MPTKVIPGVYAEVLLNTSGVPVADQSLDVIGVIGTFARGPLQEPTAVSDPAQAALIFGEVDSTENPNFLTGMWAVKLAMDQGAKRVVIVRVGAALTAELIIRDFITTTTVNAEAAGAAVVIETTTDPIAAGFLPGQSFVYNPGGGNEETATIISLTTVSITANLVNAHLAGETIRQQAVVATLQALTPGAFGNLYTVAIATGTVVNTKKFTVTGDGRQEVWDNLTNTPGTPRYLVNFLNENSTLINAVAGVSPNLPNNIAATTLAGGANGNVTTDADYIGLATPTPTGLFALDGVDVNILVVAGQESAAVHTAVNTHAQSKGDRLGVVGGAINESVVTTTGRASSLASDRMVLAYPGVKVFDPNINLPVVLPSAYFAAEVAGRIATLDPFRSPSNKQVFGLLGFEKDINDADLATLIQGGVVVGTKKGRLGFRLRDGLTTTISFPFNQINIRRLFDQIVRGITESNQDLVSEPNNDDTQHALKQGIDAFLDRLKDQGAIQDFFSKVYSSPEDQKAGFLFADIGIFPTFAADFIVIRIKPNDTGSFEATVINQ